jgi:nucleoside phosphorylase
MVLQLLREEYTVGWVCALPIELAAAQEMLDDEHDTPSRDVPDARDARDTNIYTCGRISEHNVVIACLPTGRIGRKSAASVASRMQSTFTSIRFGLMIGIGGGVPSDKADIRLGDVVVSTPHKTHGGVVQYDFGKTTPTESSPMVNIGDLSSEEKDTELGDVVVDSLHETHDGSAQDDFSKATPTGFQRTGSLNAPPNILLHAVAELKERLRRGKATMPEYISRLEALPIFRRKMAGPDVLFQREYDHEGGETCADCDEIHAVSREARAQEVAVHYGTIASGNQIMRSATERDRLSAEIGGILCIEMEAAGLMNSFPCLVVRGICDYTDSHKNQKWQAYAAGTAAAYAKELLSIIPAAEVISTRPAGEIMNAVNSEYRSCVATKSHLN